MKISNIKTLSKAFIAVVTLSVALTACSKRNNDIEPISAAGLSIINASPDNQELDFVIGNQRVNDEAFKFGSKLGYFALYPGISSLNLTLRGKTEFILSKQQVFESNKFYSVFVVGTGTTREFLTVQDKLESTATDKANVRFINLSPDAAALDLTLTGSATELASKKAFKETSDFIAVDAGDNVSFDIKDDATKAVKATLSSVKLEKGKFYTIWAKGLKDKADTDPLKFSAAVFTTK